MEMRERSLLVEILRNQELSLPLHFKTCPNPNSAELFLAIWLDFF